MFFDTAESIAARISGVHEAQRRSRLVLVVSVIASLMLLLATYNAYWSFGTQLMKQLHREGGQLREDGTLERIVGSQTIEQWVQARGVSIDALGIHVGVDDSPVIGSIALLALSLWLYQCVRKEHSTISRLLEDTGIAPDFDADERRTQAQRRWHIFHAIESHSLFVNIGISSARARSAIDSLMVYAVFALPLASSAFAFLLDRQSYADPTMLAPYNSNPKMSGPVWSDGFHAMTSYCWLICFVILIATTLLTVLQVNRMSRKLHDFGQKTWKLKP